MDTAEKVKKLIDIQQEKGLRKYGVTVDDAKLSKLEWMRHAQEEIADLLIYIQKVIDEMEQ